MTSDLTSSLGSFTRAGSGRSPQSSTPMELWSGLSSNIVDLIADKWEASAQRASTGRQQHYFSAEFLMGRALLNNLTNLNLVDKASEAVESYGFNLSDVLEAEHDAALGNGGLGRLAACFLDSCATLDLPVTGYGILYRYGLFKQQFQDGFQVEHPDPWMEGGYPFVIRREEEARFVKFDDLDVRAIPYDMPITGYGTDNVGTLRLWKSEPMEEFDYEAFNSQRFTEAIVERERVADLCRVLYPNDTTYEGKVLRVRQQYFFVSASLQAMVDNYIEHHGEDLTNFYKYNCIQLNDTHPVLAIPELMRIFLDDHGMTWEAAWEITQKTFAYTNHTTLAEALETWEYSIFQQLFGRVLEIIAEIDRGFRIDMAERGIADERINYLAPISNGRIHMAWIACYAAFSINGVAAIHTNILKKDTLGDWYQLWPEKFNNKTNGVTPRRWLNQCNPRLARLLDKLVGSDAWVSDLDLLLPLQKHGKKKKVMQELIDIKLANKRDFAAWIEKRQGIKINPDAVFDVQIKRLHEYKRQLLNAFYVLDSYFQIKDNPNLDVVPSVAIFGAKAAPGYFRAKAIIKLINEIANLVNNDPEIGDKLKVVFIENYNVTPAEKVIPAADISEQISTAGKEASGTGNMKFMMNGALTLGTLDGANVEIVDSVGDENAYIFGAKEDELPAIMATYDPYATMEATEGLSRVVNALTDGTLDDRGSGMFADIRRSLLESGPGGSDIYYVLGDFASYREARNRALEDYRDPIEWARKCWVNITESGRFSSDRTIRDYAREVWKIDPVSIPPASKPATK
ncbi:glycogen/starch/alpha-glucan phosphorylase [Flaviflexus massiliensis]|uniref:glycogen/starch/alpha-glucan phosphorylase n=1 Tax=Flaviflexus massiliensis TaxID=1522309 RepID=UPI0006D53F5A|nr:glycogen/starch/alpha-glucan phosphorylase [Flaviflexus massiliensis]